MLSSSRISSSTTNMNNKKFSTTSNAATKELAAAAAARKESADDKSSKKEQTPSPADKTANKSNVESKEEQYKKFEGDGVQFKAKLIGSELVIEPRGDKLCQDSIQRLKAIIRGQKTHKRRIVLKISYAGIKVLDEKTNEQVYHNEVPQISFIASDDTDARTFGYICDVPSKAHRFICFKTQGPAVQVMSVISLLFEAVLEQKNKAAAAAAEDKSNTPQQSADETTGEQKRLELVTADSERDEVDYLEFGYGSVLDSAGPKAAAAPKLSAKKGSMLDLVNAELGDLFIAPPPPPLPARNESFESQLRCNQRPLVKQSTMRSECGLEMSATDSGILDSPSLAGSSACSPASPTQPISLQRPPNRRQQNQHALSSSVRPSSGFMMTPSSSFANDDPFAAPATTNSGQTSGQQNRSLIYNHSSVSLNEAVLTRQTWLGASAQTPCAGTDKYAVFNDIDNLPSIFESDSSLNNADNVNKLNLQRQQPFLSASNQQQLANADSFFSASARGDFCFGGNDATAIRGPQNNASQFNKQQVVGGEPAKNDFFCFNNNAGQTTGAPQPFAPSTTTSGQLPNHRHETTTSIPIGAQPQLVQMQQVRPSMSAVFGHAQTGAPNSGLNSMVVGSAPMSGMHPQAQSNFNQTQQAAQMMQDHTRFSSSMMASANQRFGSSTASLKSAGSASGLSRQTNPFDDEFFA